MSQRQLAQQSGVDHSTISRLVRGDRMPSLGTATKLARGLRELGENDDGPQYLGLIGGGVQNPTARVEYALRADESLSEAQVRQVMEYYLAVRMRRVGPAFDNEPSHIQWVDPSRSDPRQLSPSANSPIVPRPALVAGGRAASRWRPARRSLLDFARSARRTATDRIHQLTREWPPRPRSRGRRTPALGAPAFVVSGGRLRAGCRSPLARMARAHVPRAAAALKATQRQRSFRALARYGRGVLHVRSLCRRLIPGVRVAPEPARGGSGQLPQAYESGRRRRRASPGRPATAPAARASRPSGASRAGSCGRPR